MVPSQEPVSRDDWQAWKSSKVTKQLVTDLLNERSILMEEWADGRCTDEAELRRQEGRVQKIKDVVMYIIQDFRVLDPQQEKSQS